MPVHVLSDRALTDQMDWLHHRRHVLVPYFQTIVYLLLLLFCFFVVIGDNRC